MFIQAQCWNICLLFLTVTLFALYYCVAVALSLMCSSSLFANSLRFSVGIINVGKWGSMG